MKLHESLVKVEALIKRVVTPKTTDDVFNDGKARAFDRDGHRVRKNFWCDSHPYLCFVCVRLRALLHFKKCPKAFGVTTRKGTYYWTKGEDRLYHIPSEHANWDGLKGRYYLQQRVLCPRDGLKVVEAHVTYFPKSDEELVIMIGLRRKRKTA